MSLKYTLQSLRWIKALWSPFKPFKVSFYAGKTQVGIPYFYPRKWVKATPKLAREATLKYIEKEEAYNRLNPNYARQIKPFDELYKEHMRYTYAVPLKVGFSSCGLGYKTKWTDTDYRYEYSPVFSFVFFGYQLAIMIGSKNPDSYWTAWLYYENNTNKSKSKVERLIQCIEKFPQTYTIYPKGKKETIDYYPKILRKKYLKLLANG
jgi:hypothetical protein